MGRSLVPLMKGQLEVQTAAFSQYPRGGVDGSTEDELDAQGEVAEGSQQWVRKPSPCLSKKCTMGYSIATRHNGTQWR